MNNRMRLEFLSEIKDAILDYIYFEIALLKEIKEKLCHK